MYIKVKVTAGAKKEFLEKTGEDSFAVSVREPAKRGLANKRVGEIISAHFSGKVRLVSGHTSPSKIFRVDV